MTEQSMHDDLVDLLDALGMFSGAQPISSHEVMQNAIAEVKRIKEGLDAVRELVKEEDDIDYKNIGKWSSCLGHISSYRIKQAMGPR